MMKFEKVKKALEENIVKALKMKIAEAKKNGKCVVDLEMKKKVFDKQDNGLNDMLAVYFPTSIDKEFRREIFKVSEYSEDTFRKFNSLEEVVKFIISAYC